MGGVGEYFRLCDVFERTLHEPSKRVGEGVQKSQIPREKNQVAFRKKLRIKNSDLPV